MRTVHQCRAPMGPVKLAILLLVCVSAATAARATSLTVPDEALTVQAALDANVDTVLVRPGTYAESPLTRRSVSLLAASDEPTDVPVLAGLTIQDGDLLQIQGLRVDTQVLIRSGWCCPDLRFARCDLRGGIADVSGEVKTVSVWFGQCSLGGPVLLAVRQMVRLDSCSVAGQLRVSPSPGDGCYLAVRGCSFKGDGTGTAIGFVNGDCSVESNTIRGYSLGVAAAGEYSIHIANNLIEDCSSRGIQVSEPSGVTVENNVIRRCGIGIVASSRAGVTIGGNTIAEGVMQGMFVYGESIEVTGNVVWGCGGYGIKVVSPGSHVRVAQNTSCFNVGSGFVWDGDPSQQAEWTRNISCANGEHGISWLTADPGAAVASNDWFANQAGDVGGQPPSSGDISVDPQFCDVTGGDVHLNAASPLLDWPGCGLIGALGAGCGAAVGVIEAAAAPAGFALARVGPVPTTGRIALEIALPRAAAIEVTVHDVQGRTVARLAGGEWTAGRHAIEWNGEGASGRVPPGLYLIRYRFPGGQDSRRIVISR